MSCHVVSYFSYFYLSYFTHHVIFVFFIYFYRIFIIVFLLFCILFIMFYFCIFIYRIFYFYWAQSPFFFGLNSSPIWPRMRPKQLPGEAQANGPGYRPSSGRPTARRGPGLAFSTLLAYGPHEARPAPFLPRCDLLPPARAT